MPPSTNPAIQDFYPDDFAHCYCCGRLNPVGHHLKTHWVGDGTVTRFTPHPHHIAVPGFVYGGLLASLVDCHAIATGAGAVEHAAGRVIGSGPVPRFVTAALKVDFVKPTPLGQELELRGHARELGERKVIVDVTLTAGGITTVRGEVVVVRMPDSMARR